MLAKPAVDPDYEQRQPFSVDARWLAPSLAAPALFLALNALLPGPLVLPAVSLILLVAGFGLAAANRLVPSPTPARRAKRRDLAALLVFIGFAAAILTDGGDALRVVAEIETALTSRPAALR